MFIIIDGDDTGRKIAACYVTDDVDELARISAVMSKAVERIADHLSQLSMDVVFCAADGVVAYSNTAIDWLATFREIQQLAPSGFTFSAGVGPSLRHAYLALTHAKSTGKNSLSAFNEGGPVALARS